MKELIFKIETHGFNMITEKGKNWLIHSPDGWDTSSVSFEMSPVYHGIFRSYTMPLKFVFEGADILLKELSTWGQNAFCNVFVDKLDKKTLTYFRAYTCKADFATLKKCDFWVEICLTDAGLADTLKNHEDDDVQFVGSDIQNLNSCWFTDADTGYVVGVGGVAFKITGGDTFTQLKMDANTSFPVKTLYGVCFPSADIGFIVGEGGLILKTIDAGLTWNEQSNPVPNDLRSVTFPYLDNNTGYACGDNGTILKTINGGAVWSVLNTYLPYTGTNPDPFYSICCTDANTVWAVGNITGALTGGYYQGYQKVYKTTDGGSSWTWIVPVFSQSFLKEIGPLNSIHFPDANKGYIACNSGLTLRTYDGGVSWSISTLEGIYPEYPLVTTRSLRSVHFPATMVGWMVGGAGIIYKTTDYGVTYVAQTSGTTYNLNSIYMVSVYIGYIVGTGGLVLKTTDGGTTWTQLVNDTNYDLYSSSLQCYYYNDLGPGYDHTLYPSRYVNWEFRAHNIMDVVEFVLNKITNGRIADGTLRVFSDYLHEFDNIITISDCADWIAPETSDWSGSQGIGTITFKNLFQSLDAVFDLGAYIDIAYGVETLHLVRRAELFYIDSPILDVGEVSNIEVCVDNDLTFSKVRVGYEKQSYTDEQLSFKEPNASSTFSVNTNGKEVNNISSKTLELISKIRADWQEIEETMMEPSNTNIGDGLVFNQIYWGAHYIDPVTPGTYILQDDYLINGSWLEKIPVATPAGVYRISNGLITPRRNLLRHLWHLSDCQLILPSQAQSVLKFTAGDNDQIHNAVSDTDLTHFVNEKDPVQLLEHTQTYPITVKFNAPYPADTINLLNAFNRGTVPFKYQGNSFRGLIKKFDVKLSGISDADYLLQLTKDNDLTLLMR
jgi:photosystem II stability/assembly factor-like uncharacterized protein